MTREEAIEVIEQDIPCEHDTDLIEALEMAIKALEQEPCDECEYKEWLKGEVEPKTGHWTNKEFRKEEYVLMGKCSVCGRGRVIDGFCSYCGCRMVEPQESKERSEQW